MGYRDDWFNNNESNYGWYICICCGKSFRKGDIDIDHIIPQNHGGSDKLNNLQCMCKHCNRSKQDNVGLDTVKDYSRNSANNTSKNLEKGFRKFIGRK